MLSQRLFFFSTAIFICSYLFLNAAELGEQHLTSFPFAVAALEKNSNDSLISKSNPLNVEFKNEYYSS